jgi:hypothetical protein
MEGWLGSSASEPPAQLERRGISLWARGMPTPRRRGHGTQLVKCYVAGVRLRPRGRKRSRIWASTLTSRSTSAGVL